MRLEIICCASCLHHLLPTYAKIYFEGVELLMDAIKKAGYEKEVKIGMDVAASEFLLPSGM